MPGSSADAAEAHARRVKVAEYDRFIEERLKVDLARALEEHAAAEAAVQKYEELVTNLQALEAENSTEMRTLVDLGSETFCAARVPDTRRVFVDIGLGFHAELTRAEALSVAAARAKHLRTGALARQTQKVAKIRAHITLVTQGMRELLALNADADAPGVAD